MLWSGQKLEWRAGHRRTLRGLRVGEDGPGTVLRDFEMLQSFVQERRLPVSKTYQLLPRKVLPEINALMAHPIALSLQRPQLKSYPHIQGLYLLLRVSGLGRVRSTPAKPILVISEAGYDSWRSLNPTERYFTLLESWLLRGQPEIVGERGSGFYGITSRFRDCADLIQRSQGNGLPITDSQQAAWYFRYSPGLYGVALLELFGFLEVRLGRARKGQGWQVEHVSSTPLGTAVFALLGNEVFGDLDKILALEEDPPQSFGVLQPVFQSYVPAWRNNLALPGWDFREGLHVFMVSLGRGLWRRIGMPAGLTLDELAGVILDAFGFDHDHLYQFLYRNQFGVEVRVNHPYMDEGPWTSELRVGGVPLQEGQSMRYVYDFGDWWEFDVTLERVDTADTAVADPVILEGRGEAPEQYPRWDE